MDVRIGPESNVAAVTPSRRDHVAEGEHDRPLPPAVVVELGRTPDSPGTYNARGVLEPKGPIVPRDGPAPLAPADPRRLAPDVRAEAASTSTFSAPDAVPVPTSAHVQVIAGASTEVAAALRGRSGDALVPLHHPSAAMIAGIQTLAPTALKPAERREGPAEHEEDPLREEAESPPAYTGKQAPAAARR